ncbi:MAG: DUF167 domain-containing protein [Deltaproteobacteria bacterium]|jgi:uncharacterized protein (TIGR00251 family)|nr:DUF167 domain-containing protein [Deltaproteobacteria bacterium]
MAPSLNKSVLLKVKVSPGSSKDRILGFLGDELKVSLTAPPADGKANAALLKFLARSLDIKNSQLELRSGFSSRNKVVKILGLDKDECERSLLKITERSGEAVKKSPDSEG